MLQWNKQMSSGLKYDPNVTGSLCFPIIFEQPSYE
jgi:hypothetical protein